MKHAAAAFCLLLASSVVHATPITWSFDAAQSSHTVVGDLSNLGNVSLLALNGSKSDNQTIPILTVIASTSPEGNHIDTYNGNAYNVVVDLTDTHSGDLGEFSFTGHLTGSVSPIIASLSSSFDALQTVHHTLGGHDYAVTIGPFQSPLSPTVNGELDMTVTIDGDVILPPPPTHDTPEPAALILGAWGVGAGYLLWKRRRFATA